MRRCEECEEADKGKSGLEEKRWRSGRGGVSREVRGERRGEEVRREEKARREEERRSGKRGSFWRQNFVLIAKIGTPFRGEKRRLGLVRREVRR